MAGSNIYIGTAADRGGSDPNGYVGTSILVGGWPARVSFLRLAALAPLSLLGGTIALARDPLEALHRQQPPRGQRGRSRCDGMDRIDDELPILRMTHPQDAFPARARSIGDGDADEATPTASG